MNKKRKTHAKHHPEGPRQKAIPKQCTDVVALNKNRIGFQRSWIMLEPPVATRGLKRPPCLQGNLKSLRDSGKQDPKTPFDEPELAVRFEGEMQRSQDHWKSIPGSAIELSARCPQNSRQRNTTPRPFCQTTFQSYVKGPPKKGPPIPIGAFWRLLVRLMRSTQFR